MLSHVGGPVFKTHAFKLNRKMRSCQPVFGARSKALAMCKRFKIVKPGLKYQVSTFAKPHDSRFEISLQNEITAVAAVWRFDVF